jgi:DNA-binding IclR family transcriptional regulator
MGFAIRAGAEVDVLVSASGRVLLAFQEEETRALRIQESLARRPEHANPQINNILDSIRSTGYESIPSVQVRGLYAVSFPILDSQGHAIAALTVPYAERIDLIQRKSIPEVTQALGEAARALSKRIGGLVSSSSLEGAATTAALKRSPRSAPR